MAALGARAAMFLVSDGLDTTNVASLRGAIIAANAHGGANIIVLTNNVSRLGISGADEDGALKGDLDITNGSIVILGSGFPLVTIDATGLGDRLFHVFPDAQLTLMDLIITGGAAPGNGDRWGNGECGGAIYNMGTLVLRSCVLSNNASGGGNHLMGNGGGTGGGLGGAIYSSGFLDMANCTVSQNVSGDGVDGAEGGDAGAIYNSGEAILTDCTIQGNSAGLGGPPSENAFGFGGYGGSGGGIFNSGTLSVIRSVLSENSSGLGATGCQMGIVGPLGAPGGSGGSGGSGAGLYNAGDAWLTCCTVSSNKCASGGSGGRGAGLLGSGGAPGSGGNGAGIYNAGRLVLSTCTVAGNSCGNGGDGGLGLSGGGAAGAPGGGGGGICNNGSLSLIACTIALNSTGSGGNGGGAWDYFMAAPAVSGGQGGDGGGVFNQSHNTTVATWNTLIASNSTRSGGAGGTNDSGAIGDAGRDGSGSDGCGRFMSQGFNLIGRVAGVNGLTNGVNRDLAGSDANPIDPRLSPVQINAGTTLILALLPCSPAIDAGDDSLLGPPENLTLDQRGNPRLSGSHVDIGALEYDGTLDGTVQPPLLTETAMSANGLQFWFNGAPGLGYWIWASTDLRTWSHLGSALEISRGWFLCQDADAMNHSRRFYQIRYPEPRDEKAGVDVRRF